MSLPIGNNYSILNSYNYEGKSKWMTRLDWLSSPCRRVLGGRDIYISSLKYGSTATTAEKVKKIFFSLLIFPIAIVSVASLILKLATCPYLWEKKKVKVQAKQTRDIIDSFKDNYKKNNFQGAIKAYTRRPEIGQRDSIKKEFFRAVNMIVNNGTNWNEIQTPISMLNNADAVEMLNHAITERLKTDPLVEASEIIQLIQHSLKGRSMAPFEACYEKVLQNALLIDTNNDLMVNAIKLDLAEQLIRSLEKLKHANSNGPLESTMFTLKAKILRGKLFKEGQNHGTLPLLFSLPKEREQICAAAQQIRKSSQASNKLLAVLGNLSKKDVSLPLVTWDRVRAASIEFQTEIGNMAASLEKEEQEHIQATQDLAREMITLIDAIKQKKSPEEIAPLTKNIPTRHTQYNESFIKLLKAITDSHSKPETRDFIALLRSKNVEYLSKPSMIMKATLLNHILQAAQENSLEAGVAPLATALQQSKQ